MTSRWWFTSAGYVRDRRSCNGAEQRAGTDLRRKGQDDRLAAGRRARRGSDQEDNSMNRLSAVWFGMRCAALALVLAAAGAEAAPTAASKPAQSSSPIQILPGTNSKEPISIDADKLVYFDKEQKAIYSGNVVVVQGDTKMTCSVMTVYLDRSPAPGAGAPAGSAPGSAAPAGAPQQPSQDFGHQAARGDRTGHGYLQDAGCDRRQRNIRQGARQSLSDRPCHHERRPERHEGRQVDLRSEVRPGHDR